MSYKYKIASFVYLFYFLLFFKEVITKGVLDISNVQPNVTTINTQTQYQFNIDRFSQTINIPVDAYIEITFPTAYIGRVYTTNNIANCTTISWNGNTISCSYQNNILQIQNGFPTAVNSGSFSFILNNITNPTPALTYNYFSLNIYNPNGTLFQVGNTNYSVTITVASSNCAYTLSNGIVSSMGSINVTYSSTNILNNFSQYGMIVSMPSYYPDDATKTNINASIANAVNTGTYLFNLSYTTNVVINLLMPPSDGQYNNFVLIKAYLSGSSGGDIDECWITLKGVQPNTIQIQANPIIATVQKTSSYLFSILPSTTIQPTDFLIVSFDSNFGLSNMLTNATFTNGIFGNKSISLNGNTLTLSNLNSAPLSKVTLNFTLFNIANPYDTRSSQIQVSIMTQTLNTRSKSNFTISMTPSTITTNSFSCNVYEIGTSANCQVNFTTTSYFLSTGLININFPNDFSMLNSALINCSLTSTLSLVQSFINCRTINNGTYQLSNFTFSLTNLSDTFIFKFQMINTYDFRLVLPKDVGLYSASITTISSSYLVGTGSFNITTTKRQLLASNNNSLSLSTNVTYTLTTLYFNYTLPFDLGYGYEMQVILPLDLNTNFSGISSNYGSITNYDSSLQQLSIIGINNANSSISIYGFKSYVSTKAFTIKINLLYNGQVYFYYSQSLQMLTPKTIDYFNFSQSGNVVYSNITATMIISQLNSFDLITFSTNSYNGFYSGSQSSCSVSVIACNLNNSLTVKNPNNLNSTQQLTQFSFNIQTQPYVGISIFSILILDSTATYSKQTTSFNFVTSTRNVISLNYNSSNPYYNQSTTYFMQLNLTTPNATQLSIVFPTSYIFISQQCIGNCVYQSFNAATNLIIFNVSSVQISLQITVKNPLQFNQTISITSSGSKGDQDFVSFTPLSICAINCRSCNSSNTSYCTSCYSYVANNKLSKNVCTSSCQSTEYLIINNSLFYCIACPSNCINCQSATNCSTCASTFIYFNYSCLVSCPSGYYEYKSTGIDQCMACQNICSTCLSQNYCTGCVTGYYVLNNTCVTDCPVGLYIKAGFCVNCQLNCLVCNDVTALCTICNTNYFLFSGQCFTTCPSPNYFKSTSGICQTCQQPCGTCFQYSNNCTTCINSSYYLLNNTCFLLSCPDQYFKVQSNKTCSACISPCLSCTSTSICTSCISNYSYKSGVCYGTCPTGTYTQNLNTSSICVNCVWPCIACDSSTICNACSSPQYVLYNGTCVISCPSQYFKNNNNQCQACLYPCKQCTSTTACISCKNSLYLSGSTCVSNCVYPLYPNSAKNICQKCQTPCATCLNESTICGNCITNYSILSTSCYNPCPSTYYSTQSFVCNTCASQNQYCQECSLNSNLDVSCSSCVNNSVMFGFTCLQTCPANTIIQGVYCMSTDCSNLSYCLSCSGQKCLSCHALYSPTNGVCRQVSLAQALTAVKSIPMPFPFLILALLTIISSYFLKYNFTKMFVPLYLYAICGLIEVGCLSLWTILSVLTAKLNNESLSNIYFSPVAILFIYFGFNLANFLFTFISIQKDKKYRTWEKQDNKSISTLILVASFAMSFRFSVIKFSKLGHKQSFSAILQSGQKYNFFSFLSILSIFLISILTIIASGYITYIQTSLNYLFFTSIQIVVFQVLMIILSILQVLAPKDYLIQKKQQYQQGYISQNMQGQSIQEMMLGIGVVEEYYHESKSIGSDQGKQVVQKNKFPQQEQEQVSKIQLQSKSDQLQQEFMGSSSKINATLQVKQKLKLNQQQILKSILNKQIQPKLATKVQKIQSISQKAKKINQKLKDKHGYLSTKPIGMIVKQLIQEVISSQDQIDIESQISDQEIQDQNQMSSSKLIKPKRPKHRQLQNHQQLSIQQQLNFKLKQEQIIQKQKRQQQIQRIKYLLEQLKHQQQQEMFLKQKLSTLKQKEKEEYQRARQKIECSQMGMEDKLSKLGQLFIQRKLRQQERKDKIKNIQKQIQSARQLGVTGPIQIRQLIVPKDHQIEQILPQKIKVQSKLNKKTIQKSNNKSNLTNKKVQKYTKKAEITQKQIGKIIQKNKNQKQQQKDRKIKQMKKQYKSNELKRQVPIPMQSNKSRINLARKKQKNALTEKKQQILQEQDFISQSQNQQNRQKQADILPQKYELQVEQELDLIWPEEEENVEFNHDSPWKIKHEDAQNEPNINNETSQADQNQIVEVFDHWPIDPQLAERIQSIQNKANSYLSSNKKISISDVSSLKINSQIKKYHSLEQKKPEPNQQIKKLQFNKFQANQFEDFQNSLQNPHEMLIFEQDEYVNEKQDNKKNNEQINEPKTAKVKIPYNLSVEQTKIQKRRVNRSVINLSPNKHQKPY